MDSYESTIEISNNNMITKMSTATTIHTLTLATAHLLLEIFPRNADKHAFLRVTLSTLSSAPASTSTATFSTDELALQRLNLRNLHTPPAGMSFHPDTGVLCIPHESGIARLRVSEIVESRVFVDRVVQYVSFFEADVTRERLLLQRVQGKQRQILDRVTRMRDTRVCGDRRIRETLPVLMASKRVPSGHNR